MQKANERFFNEAVNLELNIAQVYTLFASIFPRDKELWNSMAMEELVHADMIRLLKGKFLSSAKMLINTPNISVLGATNHKIRTAIEKIELEGIDRAGAFDIAIGFENMVYEVQFRQLLAVLNDNNIVDLFRQLSVKDSEHVARLIKYKNENVY